MNLREAREKFHSVQARRANLRRAIAAGERIYRRDADNAAFDFIRQLRDKLIDGIPVRHCATLAAVADVSESGLLVALQQIARAECLALSFLLGRKDEFAVGGQPRGAGDRQGAD